jgi:hypothetical protein
MKKGILVSLLLATLLVLTMGCSTATATQTQTPAVSAVASPTAAQTPAPTALTDKSVVVLTFEGATKTSMTLGEFQALKQETRTLSYTNKKGVTTTGSYSGVQWKVLAKAIGVTKYSSLEVTASDGYKITLTAAMVDDVNSLFALQKDGAQIESKGNGYVWFCPSANFTANNQAKYIVTIKIVP